MSCELYSYILCSCVGYIPHDLYLCLFIFKIHLYEPIANAIKNTTKTNTENINNKHSIMSILFIIPCIL